MKLQRSCTSGRAFTLLEILLAVAVAAILAATLWTAGIALVKAGATTKCAQHLRNIAMATQQYALEHNQMMPSRVMHNRKSDKYYPGIREYLGLPDQQPEGKDSVLSCPVLQRGKYRSTWREEYYRTYSYNHDMCSEAPMDIQMNLNVVGQPGQVPLAMDGRIDGDTSTVRYANSVREVWLGGMKNYPHGGKVNVVFVDGHVERRDAAELREPHVLWMRRF